MTDNVVAQEVALAEFDRFAECMDLDLDTSLMDAEDLTMFTKQKNRIVRAIVRGNLVVNDDGEAVYTPAHSKSRYKDAITFHERTGASAIAMDGKKKNHDVARTYAIMADMCRVDAKVFSGLVGPDIKICEALFALLMD